MDAEKILESGDRDLIIEWLMWNDRNGVYSDADCDAEEMPRLTIESARNLMRDILARD